MINTVTYKIVEFIKEHKHLRVEFEGGPAWAIVPLRDPYPTNEAELAELIRSYAPRVEAIIAAKATPDLTFIEELVGQTKTVDRKLQEAAFENATVIVMQKSTAEMTSSGDPVEDAELEEQRLRNLVLSILRENHLVADNG